MNLLIVPGTTLVAKEICDSLATNKGVELFGAGYDLENARNFPYSAFDFLGMLDSSNLINHFEEIVQRNQIDAIIFAHDSWIFEFQDTETIGNASIIKNSSHTIQICSFKSSTYNFFQNVLPIPKVFKSVEEITDFPVFLKPDRGQGSVGAKRINQTSELKPFLDENLLIDSDWVVSEYLPGSEFTVDCFSSLSGKLLYSSARKRISVKAGMAIETRVIENKTLCEWAQLISQEINIAGPWFFQAKEDRNGALKLMEIGLRIAGGSGVQRLKGVNLSHLNVLQSQNLTLRIIDQKNSPSKLRDSVELDFTFKEIYVDYDDTLIVNSTLNVRLMEFLRASRSKGITITLISRHKGNLEASLKSFQICDLFNQVIHIKNNDPKSKYVSSDGNFLFIDDSFRERLDISVKFGPKALVLDESFMMGA